MNFKLLTTRKHESRHWYDIVFEWEDEIKSVLGCDFYFEPRFLKNRWYELIPFLYRLMLPNNGNAYVYFEMKANVFHLQKGIRKIIPWIIDWYVSPKNMWLYNWLYSGHKMVFVSSKEVCDYLKTSGSKIKAVHLALSLSDKYKITSTTSFVKEYDLVTVGRSNPVLKLYLQRYQATHPDLNVYAPSKAELATREGYMDVLRKAKVTFYSTPGIDGGEKRTNGFSQVTPRFLEEVASGCNILARYKENSDTKYYELEKFSPSIQTYEQFEALMDAALVTPPDMEMYAKYLEKHYTSTRAKELKKLMDYLK